MADTPQWTPAGSRPTSHDPSTHRSNTPRTRSSLTSAQNPERSIPINRVGKVRSELERSGLLKTKKKMMRPSQMPWPVQRKTLDNLRRWQHSNTDDDLLAEETLQAAAVARVRRYLDAVASVIRVQSWWRMVYVRRAYWKVKRERFERKCRFFRVWKIYARSERMREYHLLGKFFYNWQDETSGGKLLRRLLCEFYVKCLGKLLLSRQACQVYFDPEAHSHLVTLDYSQRLKIRRLILQRLLHAWRSQTHEMKSIRFKATQILSRTVRRTRGPLWVKEATLVCFHIWYRYSMVRQADRRNLPDPRFHNPFLPQWTFLYKEMTIHRVKKKRILERAGRLIQLRAFRRWYGLYKFDQSKPLPPLTIALQHFKRALLYRMMRAWYQFVRQRGLIGRFSSKLFYAWREWAPRHHRLRMLGDQLKDKTRLRRQGQCFGLMLSICQKVIGARTEKMKQLRRQFNDRRVLICAYAMMGLEEQVIALDCWRRWKIYLRLRRSWKTLHWQIPYSWYLHKARTIFGAWRTYTEHVKLMRSQNPSWDDGSDDEASVFTVDSIFKTDAMEALLQHEQRSVDYSRLTMDYPRIGMEVFQRARTETNVQPTPVQFLFLCIAYMQTSRNLSGWAGLSAEDLAAGITPFDSEERRKQRRDLYEKELASQSCTNPSDSEAFLRKVQGASVAHNKKTPYHDIYNATLQVKFQQLLDDSNLSAALHTCIEPALNFESRFLRQLLGAVADTALPLALLLTLRCVAFLAERVVRKDKLIVLNGVQNPVLAVALGYQIARWESQLLTAREFRTLSQDPSIKLASGGVFQSVTLWRMMILQLLDNRIEQLTSQCTKVIGSTSLSSAKSAEALASGSLSAAVARKRVEEWTLAAEVEVVMTKKKVSRLVTVRAHLAELLGFPSQYTIEQRMAILFPNDSTESSDSNGNMEHTLGANSLLSDVPTLGNFSTVTTRNVYHILREYILLTGRLTHEARSMRLPLLERDRGLLVRGFLRSARTDFLELKRFSIPEKVLAIEKANLEAIKEKAARARQKEREKLARQRRKRAVRREKRSRKFAKKFQNQADSNNPPVAGLTGAAAAEVVAAANAATAMEEAAYGSDSASDAELVPSLLSEEEEARYGVVADVLRPRDFFVEALVEDLSTEETIHEDQRFSLRTGFLNFPILFESYVPPTTTHFGTAASFRGSAIDRTALVEAEEELKRCLHRRQLLELTATMRRLARLFHSEAATGKEASPWEYAVGEVNSSGTGSIGLHLIARVMGSWKTAIRWPVWSVLPTDYWYPRNVEARIEGEMARGEALSVAWRNRITSETSLATTTESSLASYERFHKRLRQEIVAIAGKQNSVANDDVAWRKSKRNRLRSLQATAAANERKAEAIRDAVAIAKSKLTMIAGSGPSTGNTTALNSIFESLYTYVPPPPPPNKRPRKEDRNPTTAKALISACESLAENLAASVPRSLELAAAVHTELTAAEKSIASVHRWMRAHAEDRFNTLVDVSQLLRRAGAAVDGAALEAKRLRTIRAAHIRGLRVLRDFRRSLLSDLVNKFGDGLFTMEGEILPPTIPAPESQKSTILNREATSDGTDWPQFGDVSAPTLDLVPLLPPHPLGNTNGTMNEATPFFDPGIVSDTKEANPVDKMLSVDEELAALHAAADEALRQERERHIAAEAAAAAESSHDLRRRIFEMYWDAFPRRSTHTDDAEVNVGGSTCTSLDDMTLSSFGAADSVDGTSNGEHVSENRTQRLWRLIGVGHSRRKREARDAVAVNVLGSVFSWNGDSRKSFIATVDPLDDEMDWVPSRTPLADVEYSQIDNNPQSSHSQQLKENITEENEDKPTLLEAEVIAQLAVLGDQIWRADAGVGQSGSTVQNDQPVSVSVKGLIRNPGAAGSNTNIPPNRRPSAINLSKGSGMLGVAAGWDCVADERELTGEEQPPPTSRLLRNRFGNGGDSLPGSSGSTGGMSATGGRVPPKTFDAFAATGQRNFHRLSTSENAFGSDDCSLSTHRSHRSQHSVPPVVTAPSAPDKEPSVSGVSLGGSGSFVGSISKISDGGESVTGSNVPPIVDDIFHRFALVATEAAREAEIAAGGVYDTFSDSLAPTFSVSLGTGRRLLSSSTPRDANIFAEDDIQSVRSTESSAVHSAKVTEYWAGVGGDPSAEGVLGSSAAAIAFGTRDRRSNSTSAGSVGTGNGDDADAMSEVSVESRASVKAKASLRASVSGGRLNSIGAAPGSAGGPVRVTHAMARGTTLLQATLALVEEKNRTRSQASLLSNIAANVARQSRSRAQSTAGDDISELGWEDGGMTPLAGRSRTTSSADVLTYRGRTGSVAGSTNNSFMLGGSAAWGGGRSRANSTAVDGATSLRSSMQFNLPHLASRRTSAFENDNISPGSLNLNSAVSAALYAVNQSMGSGTLDFQPNNITSENSGSYAVALAVAEAAYQLPIEEEPVDDVDGISITSSSNGANLQNEINEAFAAQAEALSMVQDEENEKTIPEVPKLVPNMTDEDTYTELIDELNTNNAEHHNPVRTLSKIDSVDEFKDTEVILPNPISAIFETPSTDPREQEKINITLPLQSELDSSSVAGSLGDDLEVSAAPGRLSARHPPPVGPAPRLMGQYSLPTNDELYVPGISVQFNDDVEIDSSPPLIELLGLTPSESSDHPISISDAVAAFGGSTTSGLYSSGIRQSQSSLSVSKPVTASGGRILTAPRTSLTTSSTESSQNGLPDAQSLASIVVSLERPKINSLNPADEPILLEDATLALTSRIESSASDASPYRFFPKDWNPRDETVVHIGNLTRHSTTFNVGYSMNSLLSNDTAKSGTGEELESLTAQALVVVNSGSSRKRAPPAALVSASVAKAVVAQIACDPNKTPIDLKPLTVELDTFLANRHSAEYAASEAAYHAARLAAKRPHTATELVLTHTVPLAASQRLNPSVESAPRLSRAIIPSTNSSVLEKKKSVSAETFSAAEAADGMLRVAVKRASRPILNECPTTKESIVIEDELRGSTLESEFGDTRHLGISTRPLLSIVSDIPQTNLSVLEKTKSKREGSAKHDSLTTGMYSKHSLRPRTSDPFTTATASLAGTILSGESLRTRTSPITNQPRSRSTSVDNYGNSHLVTESADSLAILTEIAGEAYYLPATATDPATTDNGPGMLRGYAVTNSNLHSPVATSSGIDDTDNGSMEMEIKKYPESQQFDFQNSIVDENLPASNIIADPVHPPRPTSVSIPSLHVPQRTPVSSSTAPNVIGGSSSDVGSSHCSEDAHSVHSDNGSLSLSVASSVSKSVASVSLPSNSRGSNSGTKPLYVEIQPVAGLLLEASSLASSGQGFSGRQSGNVLSLGVASEDLTEADFDFAEADLADELRAFLTQTSRPSGSLSKSKTLKRRSTPSSNRSPIKGSTKTANRSDSVHLPPLLKRSVPDLDISPEPLIQVSRPPVKSMKQRLSSSMSLLPAQRAQTSILPLVHTNGVSGAPLSSKEQSNSRLAVSYSAGQLR